VRATGDTIALAPPLIIDHDGIDELIEVLTRALKATDAKG
jgi:adenosylmethionine-8-amino-7-oxononanoate aminotransferase